MYTLTYHRFWLSIGIALILIIIGLSLTPAPPTFEVAHEDKIGHILAYAVLMSWFVQLYPQRRQHHILAVSFILFGVLLEGLQGLGGVRVADGADMVANSFGVLLGWALGMTRFQNSVYWFEQRLKQWRSMH